MTAISDLIAQTSRTGSGGPAAATSAADIQDRFLTLLVTQLKNQDPLSPMDNAQITTQLSQISTVSGLDKLNQTLSGLSAAMTASQSMLTGTAMIGRRVYAPGNDLALVDGRASGAVELAEGADKVVVKILGPAGNLVRELDLGGRQAGLSSFAWDGEAANGAAAANGAYTFQVEARRADKVIGAAPHLYGTVTAIGVAGSDRMLVVDGKTEVRYDELKRVE